MRLKREMLDVEMGCEYVDFVDGWRNELLTNTIAAQRNAVEVGLSHDMPRGTCLFRIYANY